MTTVVFDGGILAVANAGAEERLKYFKNTIMFMHDEIMAIALTGPADYVKAILGVLCSSITFYDTMDAMSNIMGDNVVEGIMLSKKGPHHVKLSSEGFFVKWLDAKPAAVGTGSQAALMAFNMKPTLNAIDAVALASRVDSNTSGTISHFSLSIPVLGVEVSEECSLINFANQ